LLLKNEPQFDTSGSLRRPNYSDDPSPQINRLNDARQ
jgi:hypothetical protein